MRCPQVRKLEKDSILKKIYALEPNADPASWVVERCAGSLHLLSAVVPAGFPAYLRICHPGRRVESLQPDDERGRRMALSGYEELRYRSLVRWDEVAKENKCIPHRLMQWSWSDPGGIKEVGSAGLEYPSEGELTRDDAATILDILIANAGESTECLCGFWPGFRRFESAPAKFRTMPKLQEYALLRGDLREIRDFLLLVHDEGLREGIVIGTAGIMPNAVWPTSREWYLAVPFNRPSSYFGGPEKVAAAISAAATLETYEAFPMDDIWKDTENV